MPAPPAILPRLRRAREVAGLGGPRGRDRFRGPRHLDLADRCGALCDGPLRRRRLPLANRSGEDQDHYRGHDQGPEDRYECPAETRVFFLSHGCHR